MRTAFLRTNSFLVVVALTGFVSAQTLTDSPYQKWAAWKVGAVVVHKTENAVAGKVETTLKQTQKLKSLTAEKAVLDVSSEITAEGMTFQAPPMPMEIPAKGLGFKADPANPGVKSPESETKAKMTQGKEKLTIAGKSIECVWHQSDDGEGAVAKTWMSHDVPGGVVKMVSTDKASNATTTMILVEWQGTKK